MQKQVVNASKHPPDGFEPALLEQVHKKFVLAGVSVAEWSRVKGFTAATVYRVLRGQQACRRGQGHAIAVALGLKVGSVQSAAQLEFEPIGPHQPVQHQLSEERQQ